MAASGYIYFGTYTLRIIPAFLRIDLSDVFFRDLEYLWNVVTMLIMYMSAIFYQADKLLESEYWFLIKYNPLYSEQYNI